MIGSIYVILLTKLPCDMFKNLNYIMFDKKNEMLYSYIDSDYECTNNYITKV